MATLWLMADHATPREHVAMLLGRCAGVFMMVALVVHFFTSRRKNLNSHDKLDLRVLGYAAGVFGVVMFLSLAFAIV